MAETNTMDVIFVDYLLPGEPEGTTPHHVTLKEFLALSPEQLTEQNKKIQKALGQLYKLNDREPPLFHSFPKRNVGPLVIDCTTVPKEESINACYNQHINRIYLEKGTLGATEVSLLVTFAHELKHVEQYSEELYKMKEYAFRNDGLAYHQLQYLGEAQAYAFGDYVQILFQKRETDHIKPFSDIESELMKEMLWRMYIEGSYGNLYDLSSPILKKDKGLTAEDIPDSFRFRDKQEAFSLLEDMPRDPFTPEGRRAQVQKESDEVFEVMRLGAPKKLKILVEDKLKSGEMLSDELLKMIEVAFTDEQPSAEHIQASKDMLNYFLNLKVDGKPLMSEEFIVGLLDSVRACGRKDVEEVIWKPCMRIAADAMHQSLKDDPEFVKEFVKTNLDDKSASFDDMLEIITIEFTRSAEGYTSDEHIQNSKDVLKFLLDVQLDGKHLMQEKDITKLFKNARISGRKDVEEAMLEYKAEHPEDKRFPDKMFEFNRKDKVAEFMVRQEEKKAEVKFAAENAAKKAANKGASTLTAAVKAAKSK